MITAQTKPDEKQEQKKQVSRLLCTGILDVWLQANGENNVDSGAGCYTNP